MKTMLSLLCATVLLLTQSTAASHDLLERKSHVNRQLVTRDHEHHGSLEKRFTGARMTWYHAGQGACGNVNGPGDFIVALNSAQYIGGYPGPNCGRALTISYGGKQVGAVVQDECPTCPFAGLDLTAGLFQQFNDLGHGEFYAEWWWNDEAPQQQPPPQQTSTIVELPPSPTPSPSPSPSQSSEPGSNVSASETVSAEGATESESTDGDNNINTENQGGGSGFIANTFRAAVNLAGLITDAGNLHLGGN